MLLSTKASLKQHRGCCKFVMFYFDFQPEGIQKHFTNSVYPGHVVTEVKLLLL